MKPRTGCCIRSSWRWAWRGCNSCNPLAGWLAKSTRNGTWGRRRRFPVSAPFCVRKGRGLSAAQRVTGNRKSSRRFEVVQGCDSFSRHSPLRWVGLRKELVRKSSSPSRQRVTRKIIIIKNEGVPQAANKKLPRNSLFHSSGTFILLAIYRTGVDAAETTNLIR